MRALALAALIALTSGRTEVAELRSLQHLRDALKPAGRPLVVHFWALWCEACLTEMPRQVALAREASRAGLDYLFINLDGFDKRSLVEGYLADFAGTASGARQAMLDPELDPDQVASLLDEHWHADLPATFRLSRSGRVEWRAFGPMTVADEKRFLAAPAKTPADRPR